jgi:hypothetical protein
MIGGVTGVFNGIASSSLGYQINSVNFCDDKNHCGTYSDSIFRVGISTAIQTLGGTIVGSIAGPLLGSMPNSLAKHLYPLAPIVLPFTASVVGDAIMGGNICIKSHSNHYNFEICDAPDDFLSHSAQTIMLGNAILIPGIALTSYYGYKLYNWCHRHRAANQNAAYHALNDGAEGQPAAPSTLRQRLAACYEGETPPDYLDPIHQVLMNNPIMLKCGDNYDEEFLAEMKQQCPSCPKCRAPFVNSDFSRPARNTFLRSQIIEFVEEKERLARDARQVNAHIIEIAPEDEKPAPPAPAPTPLIDAKEEDIPQTNSQKLQQLNIPLEAIQRTFICPLTKTIMDDPVRASDHCVYEKQALVEYIFRKQFNKQPIISPVTQEILIPIESYHLYKPENAIKGLIDRFFAYKTNPPKAPGSHSLFRNLFRPDAQPMNQQNNRLEASPQFNS